MDVDEPEDIRGARVLAVLGDSITTDHISPAGAIPADRPAGQYLLGKGVEPVDFNIYGSRRGNHEVMVRGTFGNIRLRNRLTPEKEGDWSVFLPNDEETSIFEASQKYIEQGIPTVIIAGKEYGSGSSRDWAAKGPNLLGVQAVVAESYERIHRNNLVGMGVMPLQFKPGESAESHGLTGRETFEVIGISEGLTPGQTVQVHAVREDGTRLAFDSTLRIDNQVEIDYYKQGRRAAHRAATAAAGRVAIHPALGSALRFQAQGERRAANCGVEAGKAEAPPRLRRGFSRFSGCDGALAPRRCCGGPPV